MRSRASSSEFESFSEVFEGAEDRKGGYYFEYNFDVKIENSWGRSRGSKA